MDANDDKRPRIFLSYRREDSKWPTGQIAERLAAHFGTRHIVFDVDSLNVGQDFGKQLDYEVKNCDFFIAVIGRSWLDARDEAGQRRLDDPSDWVRTEIALALTLDIPVIPVLLDDIAIPPRNALPDGLKDLSRRNAHSVHPHPYFNHDVNRLIEKIEQIYQDRSVVQFDATGGSRTQANQEVPARTAPPNPRLPSLSDAAPNQLPGELERPTTHAESQSSPPEIREERSDSDEPARSERAIAASSGGTTRLNESMRQLGPIAGVQVPRPNPIATSIDRPNPLHYIPRIGRWIAGLAGMALVASLAFFWFWCRTPATHSQVDFTRDASSSIPVEGDRNGRGETDPGGLSPRQLAVVRVGLRSLAKDLITLVTDEENKTAVALGDFVDSANVQTDRAGSSLREALGSLLNELHPGIVQQTASVQFRGKYTWISGNDGSALVKLSVEVLEENGSEIAERFTELQVPK